jgi:GABA(A) receptor-associated protein
MIYNDFRQTYSFYERKKESDRILSKYPDRIPIICEKNKYCKNIDHLDRKKYLVQPNLTIGQFIFVIRKRLRLNAYNALFLTINGIIPKTSEYVSTLYQKYKENDDFIYLVYSSENTFG